MGLFGNPRKKIEKWAPLVMEGYTPGMPIEEEFLDAATTLYIQQHARILYDSTSQEEVQVWKMSTFTLPVLAVRTSDCLIYCEDRRASFQ